MEIAIENGDICREFVERSERRKGEIAEAVNGMKNEVEEVNRETKKSAVRVENFSSPQNFLNKAQNETNYENETCQVRIDGIFEAILGEERGSKVDQDSAKVQEIL